MTTFGKRQAGLQALVILIACAATLACSQKPVVPSGAARVPINSDEMIQQYRERVKSDQREKQERCRDKRQLGAQAPVLARDHRPIMERAGLRQCARRSLQCLGRHRYTS